MFTQGLEFLVELDLPVLRSDVLLNADALIELLHGKVVARSHTLHARLVSLQLLHDGTQVIVPVLLCYRHLGHDLVPQLLSLHFSALANTLDTVQLRIRGLFHYLILIRWNAFEMFNV